MTNSNDYTKYGEFSADGREFVIRRFDTPRPWLNYAWSEQLLVSIDQRGRGHCLFRDGAGNRTIPIRDRFIFIKDRDDGSFWTVGWDPVKLPFEHYTCRHGLGYTVIESEVAGIRCAWTVTAAAGQPAELWALTVANHSGRPRRLGVYAAVEFDLGGWVPYGSLENYSLCRREGETRLVAYNRSDERPQAKNHALFAASSVPDHYETRKREFLGGCYNTLQAPQGVIAETLTNADSANEEFIGAFQYDLEMAPGAAWDGYFAVGPFMEPAEALAVAACASRAAFAAGLAQAATRTAAFSRVDFELPDPQWTRLFNVWTKQQLFLLKDYARLFLIGFRDTLQDAQSVCAYAPELAAESILTALNYQYRDGSAMRGWCPDDHHKYGDSGVWLPFAVAEYLRETGNAAFLQRRQAYRDGGEATVWEHVCQAMEWFALNLGSHGLPKLYFGDWNDSLNIGRAGKGESVWLGMALVAALRETAGMAGLIGDSAVVAVMAERAASMKATLESCAWDGDWYLRGFNDDGQPVGSQNCEDGKIFSEPQSWAFLAGLDPARLALVTAAVDRHLRTPAGLVVCNPPFRHYDPQYGRISCMLPGWGENGSCYCHVTAFQAVADCLRRDGDAALASLTSIAPFNPALPVEKSWLEPYAFSNMFRGPAHPRPGATFKGWTSGTVPWALRCMTHFLLGVRPDYDALVIDPVLPSSWERVALTRTFRGAVFQIEIVNPERVSSQNAVCRLTVDGQPLAGNRLACRDFPDGIHAVRVDIGA